MEPGTRGAAVQEKGAALTLARDTSPRLHVQWDGTAAQVWLGMDAMPDVTELLRTLQRALLRSGLELDTLVCNGRPLIASRVTAPAAAPSTQQES